MAFSLSDRISSGRIRTDPGSGFRGNTADYSGGTVPMPSRAGAGSGADDNQATNSMPGSVHTAPGFRRALESTERTAGRLSGDITAKQHFGGKGFNKPNYFAQGQRRHGMHIGSGAPATVPATDTGSEAGGV